jgi:hypothetical protein
MAKFIEGKDGSRMLVSDDVPEDIEFGGNEIMSNKEITSKMMELIKADPASILLCFAKEDLPVVPVQADKFIVDEPKIKLAGTMLLVDYAWLLENLIESISHLEIRTENRIYKIANGPMLVTRFVGKDINATTVNVNVSFKRYI